MYHIIMALRRGDVFPGLLVVTLTLTLAENVLAQVEPDLGKTGSICPPEIDCFNGYCPAGSMFCECHPGFGGFACETACPQGCEANGACETSSQGDAVCSCYAGFEYVSGTGCSSVDDNTTTAEASNTRNQNVTAITTTRTPQHPTTTTALQSTTLRHIAMRTCAPGFVCVHGQCAPDSIRCECDEGWSGAFCGEVCSKNCTDHGRCMVHVDGTSYCSCHWLYTGEYCEDKMPPPPPIDTSTTDSSLLPANYNDTLRGFEVRSCLPGFVCLYGRCTMEVNATGPSCECDPGWQGVFCQNRCDLDCGEFGLCRTTAWKRNLKMYCSCVDGYTGARCNRSTINDTVPDFEEIPMTSVDWDISDGLRPLEERECVVGFVCKHGRCTDGSGIKCDCDPGYLGVFCHVECTLQCVHGNCSVQNNGTAVCNCDVKYTGFNCSEPRKFPELDKGDSMVQWYVVGACGAVLLILIVLLFVLPYWMWKRGHIFMMKLIYHFKSFEDDDKKQYDAFISYSSTDNDFVVHQLFPKLTEMKFKVCVHQKDFIAGETIANNIIDAVDNSRRTILVVTPDFIRSEFCRFEYQQAQYQMIKQRQRIIPIVLRDVAEEKKNMDATLRSILETITYLDYPQDEDPKKLEKFWKRLELSMPKRKARQGSVHQNDPSTYLRLDSTSSGYSTASSASRVTAASVSSARGSNQKGAKSESRPPLPARDPRSGGNRGDRRRSSSSSRSQNGAALRVDSVEIEMERPDRNERVRRSSGGGGRGDGYSNGYVNPAYAMK
ncbi:uncharacterized protein [Littorina saxatilis]|uniref:uncharacterized protein n=1 Tax=Littorina saxatilis TaxID=31220 RepID=UPI0038B60007